MTTESTSTAVGERPTVRVQRHFPHPIAKVWRAVTTPEHLAMWFPSPVEIELHSGGAMRFSAFEQEPAGTGVVESVDPPHRLSFTWGTDRLVFELTEAEGGTTFTLTHTFDDRAGAASFGTGWEMCLEGLRSVLAGGPPAPADRGVRRHEELVRELGLDRPEITESAGRWTVRIERQLTCPAEVAWDLWFGRDIDTGEQRSAPAVGAPLTPYMAPDLVIGTVTEVVLHQVLAVDLAPTGGPGEHLRLDLGPGTGHGARITLTVSGTEPAERDAAVAMWAIGAIGHLAAAAAEWAVEHPAAT